MRSFGPALFCCAAFFALCAAAAPAAASSALAPTALRGTYVGAVTPAAPITLFIALRGQHPGDVDGLIAAQNTPGSPRYRHYLTPGEYGRFFGAPAADYARAISVLRARGFTVDERFANQTDIVVHAPARVVESFFGTPIDLRNENGRVFFTNRYIPQFPPSLHLLSVAGLNNYVQWRPHAHHQLSDPLTKVGKLVGWGPPDIQSVYNLTPIYAKYTGAGQTVVDATYGLVRTGDFSAFTKQFGLQATLTQISDKGTPLDPYGESTLDVEYMAAIAPHVNILLVSAKNQDVGFLNMHARIINDLYQDHIVSTSWGFCEQHFTSEFGYEYVSDEKLFEQAQLEGQWWMAAAGDQGSDDCEMTRRGIISVDFPSSSPHVLAVGGTRVIPTSKVNDNYKGWSNEVVWNSNGCGASAGGYSTLFAKPAFQRGLVRSYMRQVPDVALMADGCYLGGYVIYLKGKFQNSWYGTSFAAPEWGAFFTLIQGRYGATPISNPLYRLYNLAATPAYSTLFHSVTSGCNGWNGVPGYCIQPGKIAPPSGLGSFNGAPLQAAY